MLETDIESVLKAYKFCIMCFLLFFSPPGIFVLETASGESGCPVIVLPSHRDLPHYSHGGACSGVGRRARGDRGGCNGHIIGENTQKPHLHAKRIDLFFCYFNNIQSVNIVTLKPDKLYGYS